MLFYQYGADFSATMFCIVLYISEANMLTAEQYSNLDQAYDYFNRELFDSELPDCMITLHRKANTAGYYAHERFQARDGDALVAEIALNPDAFEGRSDEVILSTLVHEMAHCWQFFLGNPSRRAYHNKEWAAKMEAVGLMPSSTGEPGGSRVGQKMTHYIISGGRFDVAVKALLKSGFAVKWGSQPWEKKPRDTSKVKYACDECGLNAWAKAGCSLVCGDCGKIMEECA